jgi:hypothetical protein
VDLLLLYYGYVMICAFKENSNMGNSTQGLKVYVLKDLRGMCQRAARLRVRALRASGALGLQGHAGHCLGFWG